MRLIVILAAAGITLAGSAFAAEGSKCASIEAAVAREFCEQVEADDRAAAQRRAAERQMQSGAQAQGARAAPVDVCANVAPAEAEMRCRIGQADAARQAAEGRAAIAERRAADVADVAARTRADQVTAEADRRAQTQALLDAQADEVAAVRRDARAELAREQASRRADFDRAQQDERRLDASLAAMEAEVRDANRTIWVYQCVLAVVFLASLSFAWLQQRRSTRLTVGLPAVRQLLTPPQP